MNQETWIKWEPVAGLEERVYCITSFLNDIQGLTIILEKYSDEPVKTEFLRIFFHSPIVFYSKTGESLCVLAADQDEVDYGFDIGKWTFFKIVNSPLTHQLQQSFPDTPLFYFVITELESETRVVVAHEPIVTWEYNEEK